MKYYKVDVEEQKRQLEKMFDEHFAPTIKQMLLDMITNGVDSDNRPEEIKKILRDLGYKQPRKENFSFKSTPPLRKLKATWTPELANDLKAYHSIDAEKELAEVLSKKIASEIDDEILISIIKDKDAEIV